MNCAACVARQLHQADYVNSLCDGNVVDVEMLDLSAQLTAFHTRLWSTVSVGHTVYLYLYKRWLWLYVYISWADEPKQIHAFSPLWVLFFSVLFCFLKSCDATPPGRTFEIQSKTADETSPKKCRILASLALPNTKTREERVCACVRARMGWYRGGRGGPNAPFTARHGHEDSPETNSSQSCQHVYCMTITAGGILMFCILWTLRALCWCDRAVAHPPLPWTPKDRHPSHRPTAEPLQPVLIHITAYIFVFRKVFEAQPYRSVFVFSPHTQTIGCLYPRIIPCLHSGGIDGDQRSVNVARMWGWKTENDSCTRKLEIYIIY